MENKKLWISFSFMTKHMHIGRLGLPNLKAYHIAVILDQIKCWWHNSLDKNVLLMEAGTINVTVWKAVLLDPIGYPNFSQHLPPTALVTYQYWKTLVSKKYR